ncbi:MAG TPA: isoprenylcysteine carboxylmethyltransferase family protein [Terracidiphilus sp.]
MLKLNIATLILILAFAIFFGAKAFALPWTAVHIVGASIAAPSLLLLMIARLQLGRAFSVQAKARNLVTTGLYSRMRNPIYVFAGFVLLGVVIFVGKPWWLLIFAVLVPLQMYRSRKEARVLEETFGDAYREYRKKTWF